MTIKETKLLKKGDLVYMTRNVLTEFARDGNRLMELERGEPALVMKDEFRAMVTIAAGPREVIVHRTCVSLTNVLSADQS